MKSEQPFWIGVDFGAKRAGTTAVCYQKDFQLVIVESKKKQDADIFLSGIIKMLYPTHIFIDAPLTLPGIYSGMGDDYFFRKGDKAVGAMSPMFIGGLTARAIKMKDTFPGIPFLESYPSFLGKNVLQHTLINYKKTGKPDATRETLETITGSPLVDVPVNYHQLDAILCWITGKRYFSNEALCFGSEQEGTIWV